MRFYLPEMSIERKLLPTFRIKDERKKNDKKNPFWASSSNDTKKFFSLERKSLTTKIFYDDKANKHKVKVYPGSKYLQHTQSRNGNLFTHIRDEFFYLLTSSFIKLETSTFYDSLTFPPTQK